jgi:AAA+ ATPase superfamily predicted ATPase
MVMIFDGQHCECGFVGRTKQLEVAATAWKNGTQIFAIYGFKSVGKTRLAKEVILRHWVSGVNLFQLDVRGITSMNDFIIHVTTGIKLVEQATITNWIQVVCQCLKNRAGDKDLVVFIENAEDVDHIQDVKSAFLKLCQELVKVSTYIKVIFTSSVRFRFIGVRRHVSQAIDVPELQPEESKSLLREVIGDDVDLGEYEDQIVEHCSGLPLAIQIAGKAHKYSGHGYSSKLQG